MTALAPRTELERLAHERDGLVAWLAREFADVLSVEDAEDLVSEALPELASDPKLPARGRRRRSYLRRALWRDALDELRHRYGRDLRDGARRLVPIADAAGVSDEALTPERELEAAQAQAQQRATVERTLARLRLDDAEVLRLKYLEERAPEEIAAQLGITRSQYERRLAQASARGRDALTSAESGPTCDPVRQLLRTGAQFTRHDAARIDAHLLDCLHCRVLALRARGLLEVIGVSVIGAGERLAARLGSVIGRGGGAAAHDAQDAALASGSAVGAGTALTVGLGTKVAVGCAGVTLAAVCAGPARPRVRAQTDRRLHAAQRRARALPAPNRRATGVRHATADPDRRRRRIHRDADPDADRHRPAQAPERPAAGQRQRTSATPGRRHRPRIRPEATTPQVTRTSTANASAATAGAAHSQIGSRDVEQQAHALWESAAPVSSRELPEPARPVEIEDLIDPLIEEGLPVSRAEEVVSTMNRIIRLASWYSRHGGVVGEHEIRTFLIVPLLLALGWPEQCIKIEYSRADVALFDHPYTGDGTPTTVIESKRLYEGLGAHVAEQAAGYAASFERCKRLVVSDGFRYRLVEADEDGAWTDRAYANLLRLRDRDPLTDLSGADKLFLALLPRLR